MTRLFMTMAVLLAAPAAAAAAGGFQDLRALDRAVADFTGAAVGRTGGARAAVDPRLKLASCPTVALAWRTPAQDAVVVRCAGPAWRIFVPVLMPASVIVAAGAAPRTAVTPAQPPQPPVIRRGDPITIEAGTTDFSITREGVALGDAALGGRFLVRVEDAKGPVQATAVAAGRATLPGWAAGPDQP